MRFYQVLLFLFILYTSNLLNAQETTNELSELSIIGLPEKSLDEMVGVRDVNGRICAAIQFISDADGFKYNSYNGVVRVDDEPGRDMVFLQPDERVVEVFKTGHKPLKIILSEYGIQLNSKEVWVINIKADASNEISVIIDVNPDDALILVDEDTVQSKKSFKTEPGEHDVSIVKSGYNSIKKTINVSEEDIFFEFVMKKNQDEEGGFPWVWVGIGAAVIGGGAAALLGGNSSGGTDPPSSNTVPQPPGRP